MKQIIKRIICIFKGHHLFCRVYGSYSPRVLDFDMTLKEYYCHRCGKIFMKEVG